ncbi:MAG: putative selenium-dependent hydroxylase accessory protein YqeC [Eubacteriales bacterium]|nr:putative selenium-dependent hydroxylase accessory protein YqeC [Eubacteriales bacterium]
MQTILLKKTDRLSAALDIPRGITSIVGGGGKTTLMLRLARELSESGARVIVTTTTHIFPPEGIAALANAAIPEIETTLERERLLCLGTPCGDGKLAAPDIPMEKLAELADHVLVEADGAKRLPLKAPANHEPVIPAQTKLVVAVAGLDGLGKSIGESAFRPALYAALLGENEEHRLTASDLAYVLVHENGQRKGVQAGIRFCIVLNKADDEERTRAALEVALQVQQTKAERIIITALGNFNE